MSVRPAPNCASCGVSLASYGSMVNDYKPLLLPDGGTTVTWNWRCPRCGSAWPRESEPKSKEAKR